MAPRVRVPAVGLSHALVLQAGRLDLLASGSAAYPSRPNGSNSTVTETWETIGNESNFSNATTMDRMAMWMAANISNVSMVPIYLTCCTPRPRIHLIPAM